MTSDEVYELFGVADYAGLVNAIYLGFPRGDQRLIPDPRGRPHKDTYAVVWLRHNVNFWLERFLPTAEAVLRARKKAR